METLVAIIYALSGISLLLGLSTDDNALVILAGIFFISSAVILIFTNIFIKKPEKTYKPICDYHISVNLKGYSIITEDGDTLKTIKFGEIPKLDTIIYNDNK
jgi:hypothetical protein